jgi:Tfp pilus assembly protein PilN
MMRRIELLPATYVERRKQRRTVFSIVVAGVVALALLIGYFLVLTMQVGDAKRELAEVQASNDRLEDRIAELQRFAELDEEVRTKQAALGNVFEGDVDWPSVLTEVAMVIPGEVWLTELTASAGQTEGATQVGTETAAVRINDNEAFGRIQFTGQSLSMPGIAKWLIRVGTVNEFDAVWLNTATESSEFEGQEVIDMDSTLEMSEGAASGRFTGGQQ